MNRNPNNMVNICADMLIEATLWEKEHPERIRDRMRDWFHSYLDGTAVGAILLNTNYHVSYIPSAVWDTAWQDLDGNRITYEALNQSPAHWSKAFVWAHEHHIEPYRLAVELIHEAGAEAWFSVRMNEFHYLNKPEACATLWKHHPEYRIAPDQPLDYSHPEVRAYYKRYIEELCRNQDIDGIELDIWRGPNFFAEPIDAAKTKILTDFMAELAASIRHIASEKGKRIRISARTDVTPQRALQKGWDSVQWVADGSVDVLTLSNFFIPTTFSAPVEEWVECLNRKGIPRKQYAINVCADMALFCNKWDAAETRWLAPDTVSMKGFASTMFDRGADGIYTFNLNNRDYMMEKPSVQFSEFTDPLHANTGSRSYILTYDEHAESKCLSSVPFQHGETRIYQIYIPLVPSGASCAVRIGTSQKQCTMLVKVNGQICPRTADSNGAPIAPKTKLHTFVASITQTAQAIQQYRLDPDALHRGQNTISIQCPESEIFSDLLLSWLEISIDT